MRRAFSFVFICATAVVSATRTTVAADTPRPAADTVVVTADRDKELTEPSEQTVKLTNVPGTFGDPIQAIYSLPGIVPSGQDGGAPAVRGSGPGDNAYLIDFLPAGFIFHDFGDSIFTEGLLRDFGVMSAGYGARFGGADGAIFDATLREPRVQPLRTTLDASLLRVGAMVESRLSDDQAFYASYRESLVGLLVRIDESRRKREDDEAFSTWPRAHDFTAKYSWTPGPHDRLSVLAIQARDTAALDFGPRSEQALIDPASSGEASVDTSFESLGAHWRHEAGATWMEAGLGVLQSERHDRSGGGTEFADVDGTRWTAKARVEHRLSPAHVIGAGVEWSRFVTNYEINLRYRPCSFFSPECQTEHGDWIHLKDQLPNRTGAAFVEDTWQASKRLSVTTGLRYSDNQYLDEAHLEPRVSARFALGEDWLLQGSFGEYHQAPGIVQVVPELGNPQLTMPSARHYVLGLRQDLGAGWSWTLDTYYKRLTNLVVDVDDSSLYANRAEGETYGAEVMLNKEMTSRWYGWLAVSLSRSRRTDDINGETAPFNFDVPVVATLVGNYQLTRWWSAGARWTFRSGMPYTPIVGNHENPDFAGYYLPTYGTLNGARAAPFHRLDLRVERVFGSGRRVNGSFYFDVINAYGRNSGGAAEYKPVAGSSNYRLEESDSVPRLISAGVKVSF